MDGKQLISIFLSFYFVGVMGIAFGADQFVNTPRIGKRDIHRLLRSQAQQARKTYPQLFDYLEKRDKTLQDAIVSLSKQIPDPSRLPTTNIRLVPPVIEKLAPQSEAQCSQIRTRTFLSEKIRERAYWLCRNVIYAKNPEFKLGR